jgi:uncharacterized membrane protein YphA (DoxX/SURF4 family)
MLSYGRNRDVDLGIFLLRVGFGFSMLIFHGYGKLTGGPEKWAKIGESLQTFGIDSYPVFWGFMAVFAEFFCSAFIIAGVFFMPAAFFLSVNMIVAVLFTCIFRRSHQQRDGKVLQTRSNIFSFI